MTALGSRLESAPRERLASRLGLFNPIDPASLAFFRIGFGLIVAWEMLRYLDPNSNWVFLYYLDPDFLFKYTFFGWVEPLPGPLHLMAFVVTGVAGVMVAFGLFYRTSAVLVFLGLSYIFFLDKARYLNHWYLMMLVAFLMIFIPAAKTFSVDARQRGKRSSTVPAWSLWLLRFQIAVPYFFGGIAKLNADWLRGEPIATWLESRQDFPLVGPLFETRAYGVATGYAALIFDLSIVFLLLNRRTRRFAFPFAILFNLANERLFSIGIFPWMMIVGTMMFFEPDWPRRVIEDFKALRRPQVDAFVIGGIAGLVIGATFPDSFALMKTVITGVAVGLAAHQLVSPGLTKPQPESAVKPAQRPTLAYRMGVGLLALWVLIQVLVPFRHLLIPGRVHWTEEGHAYSWHMKLRDKEGEASFVVLEPDTGRTTVINPIELLTDRQADRVATRPDMAVQFAHYLEERFRTPSSGDLAVFMNGRVQLNNREPQPLIDPTVDLTTIKRPWMPPADWILPLEQPLFAESS